MGYIKSLVLVGIFSFLSVKCDELAKSETLLGMLKFCRRNETRESVAPCLLHRLGFKQEYFAKGEPDVGLPSLDPLLLDDLTFREISGNSNITSVFREIKVKGYTEYEFKELDVNYTARTVHMLMYYDTITLNGKYRMDGRVVLFPIHGDGTFWIQFKEVNFAVNMEMFIKDDHMQFNVPTATFTIGGDISMRFNNLIKDPILGETVNVFLNQNSESVIREVQPQIENHLRNQFGKVANNAFIVIKLDDVPGAAFLKE